MPNPIYRSASRLLADIRNRRIGCAELLEAFIERIERKNPEINAVVTTDYEAARRRAKAADEALDRGEQWGPLHGLPITIKDTFEVAGMPCTAGLPALESYVPAQNADAVQSLVDAGAVIIGKTNVPMAGNDFQTYNDVYGQSNNPWDISRTPGGSSGGAAAALAAGMAALELGSDLGGSIRLPAHLCGVFGHKSSFNVIPKQGHIPVPPGVFPPDYAAGIDVGVVGPMARSAGDLVVAMDLLVRPDRAQRAAWKVNLPLPVKKRLKDFRIGLWLDDPFCPVDAAVGDLLQQLADTLARAGAKIEESKPNLDFRHSHAVFVSLFSVVGSADMPLKMYDRLAAEAAETGKQDNHPRALYIKGITQSHRDWLKADRERQQLRRKWAEYFEDKDVLLCPSAPVTAFPHDHGKFYDRTLMVNGEKRPYGNTVYTWSGLAGVACLPATAVPAGLTVDGLPAGAQIVGPYLGDRTTLQLAMLIEEAAGGFVPPPEAS
ncbi:MAG: amidase [Deltaproteobacteria bacterium]|nr:amidase [Deltaproteobacteria bacterium]